MTSEVNADEEESQYFHLLSTNEEPSSLEVLELQKIIQRRESKVAQLDSQPFATPFSRNSPIEHEGHDRSMLSRFRSILSPVRRLPPEILTEIFLFTRDWTSDTRFMGEPQPLVVGPRPGASPLRITHVCSRWRDVALGIPKLWATITSCHDMYDPSVPDTDPTNDVRLHSWLAWTGMVHPLQISFNGRPLGANSEDVQTTPLSWMRPYMFRIKELFLSGDFEALPGGFFLILELLVMSDFSMHSTKRTRAYFPSLRRVDFRGHLEHLPNFLPWEQLTHLDLSLETADGDVLLDILSFCVSLIKLETSFSDIDNYELDGDENTVMLPSLKSLVSLNNYGEITMWLLSSLTLPFLEAAYISYATWSGPAYSAFQARSSCPLTSLTLDHAMDAEQMEAGDFLTLLRETPSLVEIISYNAIYITPALIAGLVSSVQASFPRLVPNLEYFAIWNTYPQVANVPATMVVDDKAILDMVTSRDPSGKPAVLETNPPPGVRVFRCQVPKRPYFGHLSLGYVTLGWNWLALVDGVGGANVKVFVATMLAHIVTL
ncbi:hypothetical protein Hypma_003179 [Hypsizygus marmoreus]|uniref:Uncharacterized protein n=1 Tax=Hypsizygus marmoreus TaxID=39966 RepID=A0A369K7G0_HYPMA|nr:hypothetical protein Hypma_003179 [Hypsizygus marmoreus]